MTTTMMNTTAPAWELIPGLDGQYLPTLRSVVPASYNGDAGRYIEDQFPGTFYAYTSSTFFPRVDMFADVFQDMHALGEAYEYNGTTTVLFILSDLGHFLKKYAYSENEEVIAAHKAVALMVMYLKNVAVPTGF